MLACAGQRSPRRFGVNARIVAALLLLSACGGESEECPVSSPCPPYALTLRIRPAGTQAAVPGVTISGGAFLCSDADDATYCGAGVGDYHLRIEAPGYESVTLDASVPAVHERCSCGFAAKTVAVDLTPVA